MPYVDTPLPESLELKPIAKRVYGKPFGPNNPPPGRRGAVAKITRDLKEGIIDAAVIVGSDGKGTGGLTGFLVDLAMNHKRAYASLLVKLLPMQVAGDGRTGSRIGTINVIGVPSDTYLSAADIEKYRVPAWSEHERIAPPGEVIAESPDIAPGPEAAPEPEPEFEPQSPAEARLLDELRSLSRDELLRRAKQAGLIDADEE